MRLAIAPLCVAFFLFVMDVTLHAVPGALLKTLILLEVFPRAALAIAALISVLLVLAFWRRHWVSGVTMLAGLLTVAFLANVPRQSRSISGRVVDVVHVVSYRGTLQRQVSDYVRQGVSPTVAVVPIDGFGSLTSGIAFDPTGEILLPAGRRSEPWKAVTAQTDLGIDTLKAWHIVGNYYGWFHY